MKKGLTLIELIMVIVLFVILAVVAVYIFRAVLISWSSQEIRSGIDISLDRGIEEIARDLREARQVNDDYDGNSIKNDEIRFTQDLTNYYIYYFYNENDFYPPVFGQTTYQLRKATLTGGISGTFTYGSGDIKIIDILPPSVSDLSINGNITTIDLSVRRGDETIRSRTQIRPRNL